MVEAMIGSLKALKAQIQNVVDQLEWAWQGHMPEHERLKLLARYEMFQHTIDVHLEGSEKMLEIIIRNKVVEVEGGKQPISPSATSN
jgi:hypothetical protein